MNGPLLIAGLGCRKGVTTEALEAALALALSGAGRAQGELAGLAAPCFKQLEPGLTALAERLGLPLILVERRELEAAQTRCPSRSTKAEEETGLASVAEAAALAAADPGATLLGPRSAKDGATCALAQRTAA